MKRRKNTLPIPLFKEGDKVRLKGNGEKFVIFSIFFSPKTRDVWYKAGRLVSETTVDISLGIPMIPENKIEGLVRPHVV